MCTDSALTDEEFAALREIGRGPMHDRIPREIGMRLIELGLAYRLLGEIRITSDGRRRLLAGR